MDSRADAPDTASPDSARPETRRGVAELIGRTPATLLRAPAGFGKSTAMRAHRAMSAGQRSAWVSFDAVRPLQIGRVADLLIDASSALTGTSTATSGLRSATVTTGRALGDGFVAALTDELLAVDEPWTLYLDDLHRIPATALEELGDLAQRLADADGWSPAGPSDRDRSEHDRPHRRLVLATRTTPPWPLSRWQMAGWLTVIGPDDLRLDEAETRRILGDDHAARSDEVLATTTGWPAAVATVCSLVGASRPDEPLAEVGGLSEALDTYIRDEVVAELDPNDLTLITCLLVVGDAPPPVLATVCGGTDVVAHLRRLVKETALVVEQADERFGLHPLLARVLADRLERLGPHEVRSLHERAAHAWAELPESVDGIAATSRHLAAAGDPVGALEHVRQHWERFFDGGRLDLVVDLIEAVPSRYWRADTGLCLILGWSNLLLGRETRAQEIVHGTTLGEDPAGAAIWKIIRGQATWWRIDPVEAVALVRAGRSEVASIADDELPDMPGHRSASAFRVVADIAELRALLLSGHLSDADELGQAVTSSLWHLEPLAIASVLGMRALVAALRGRPADARNWADEAHRRATELGGDQLFPAPAHLADAVVRVFAGDPGAARPHLDRAITAARQQRAGNLLRMCDLVAALGGLGGTDLRTSAIPHAPLPFVDRVVAARQSIERLRLGDLDGAERTLLAVDPDELTLAIWAEVLLAVRPRREVARLVAGQPRATSPAGDVIRHLAEATCLPDSADASPTVRQAVQLAERSGILGVVLDAPDALLERPEVVSMDDRTVRRILDERAARRAADDRPRFSRRELEVLERTARSETATEIAGRMYLSVNTVKWHKANIYRKLGVDGAPAAIARARELGLLPHPD